MGQTQARPGHQAAVYPQPASGGVKQKRRCSFERNPSFLLVLRGRFRFYLSALPERDKQLLPFRTHTASFLMDKVKHGSGPGRVESNRLTQLTIPCSVLCPCELVHCSLAHRAHINHIADRCERKLWPGHRPYKNARPRHVCRLEGVLFESILSSQAAAVRFNLPEPSLTLPFSSFSFQFCLGFCLYWALARARNLFDNCQLVFPLCEEKHVLRCTNIWSFVVHYVCCLCSAKKGGQESTQ